MAGEQPSGESGEAISTEHAVIRYDKPSGELFVTDTSSGEESRVYVNGQKTPLGAKQRLAVNDTISIAGYLFEIRSSADASVKRRVGPAAAATATAGTKRARDDAAAAARTTTTGEAGAAYAFKIGQRVEVTSYEEGYRGSWFDCVVLDLAECKGVALVYTEYKDMQATEDEKDGMLKEWIPISATHAKKKGAKKAADAASGKKAPPAAEKAAREAIKTAKSVAPLIEEYTSRLVPRARVRPATRPPGYNPGDQKKEWPTGAFIEGPYADGWWTGYVISKTVTDVQVAFLKAPVGEGGYERYDPSRIRRALEWTGAEWFDWSTDKRFPPQD
jgi:hypothetical protein